MSILNRILETKRHEVELIKAGSCARIDEAARVAPPVRNFARALRSGAKPALIAEVKKASPSKGLIREDFQPAAIAQSYSDGGASCISVLTDTQYFQGCLDDLRVVRSTVSLPLLRKDFIIDPVQLLEARAAGADAFLLIVAALSNEHLKELRDFGERLEMSALIEVHDRVELERALECGATIIGINNRDLKTFKTDMRVTEELIALVPEGVLLVSESGINTVDDVHKLRDWNVDAMLVGESLMRSPDIRARTQELLAGRRSPAPTP